jgi:putative ABC transport system substrate-binding protein
VVADINAVSEVSARNGIAFFSGTPSSISQGALAALGVDYYLVGYAAGKKASLVLKGIDPATIPLSRGENFSLILNQKAARALGIVFPADMLRIADRVIE